MDPMTEKKYLVLDVEIEELEPKIAPASGETVLPLPDTRGGGRR